MVLDPFLGSGTTAVAATQQGRNWLGVELNEEYCAIARRRIAEVQGLFTAGSKAAAEPASVVEPAAVQLASNA